MRMKYWSGSKLADAIRGTVKPEAETSEGWAAWDKLARASHPIRFWIAEEGLDKVQNIVNFPKDALYKLKYAFLNRFVTKTHALTSNLKRGEWHEFDTRLLNTMFDELVNFVEVELAWSHIAWDADARAKYKTPWYASGFFRLRTWRSAEAGIAHLKWASELTHDYLEDDHPDRYKPTHQAVAAQEIFDLYTWWKHVRPQRPDPYDASGWTQLCDDRAAKADNTSILALFGERTEEEKAATRTSLAKIDELERIYETEDEEMMVRLIKVRHHLWT